LREEIYSEGSIEEGEYEWDEIDLKRLGFRDIVVGLR
jgi:hypothetical protein